MVPIGSWRESGVFFSPKNENAVEKYLGSRKYLEDLRRCKIEFWTTFIFYTMMIFLLILELESFKILGKIFLSKYFLKFSNVANTNRSGKINMV